MSIKTNISTRWTTVATLGLSAPVSRDNENPMAHGGICKVQLRRRTTGGMIARKVNVNGRHQEIGDSFEPGEAQIAQWEAVAECER